MQRKLKEERGVTLVELITILALLGIVFSLSGGLFYSIAKTSSIQKQMVEIQQTANGIVSEIESISKIPGLYEEAGYIGKYVGKEWEETHIIKPLKFDEAGDPVEMTVTDEGENRIALTDITDTLNQSKQVFQLNNPEIKIKIMQEKNENELTKTIYSTPNYRDTFSIQTTVMVLFYRDKIDFSKYHDDRTGGWSFDELKALSNVVYSRETVVQYRDNAKAKGDIPGNGRW
ncbi:pilus assembly FimT family protein [Carnobacterium gallinarum]|uniref:pilus assembly FimT family protein n=1 Tax=Carnobacterium gallinarum TaxID=2749 RepID=UPI000554DF0A|nr:hypothetical protein [Carnobacterium gallinarum]